MAPTSASKPRVRLGSLKKSPLSRNKPAQRPATAKHNCCANPKVEDDGDGHLVCQHCYVQISESNIVADVTFQEDARGAASVQGGFVSENARHARTLGPGVSKRVGGGEKNTEEASNNARRILATLCQPLRIPASISDQAVQIYQLTSNNNRFNAGRKTEEVVAACLFAACRRQPENTIMLMDISELQRVSVFRIGQVYTDLCKLLYLDSPVVKTVGKQHIIDIESLIMRFCQKLEFGDKIRQVAEDAAKIIRRMKRDWMVTGRHPAGLCGACVILAARMNNFRRTVREVVYVAKVADLTIAKRVEEFRRTKSSELTVEQFREVGVRLRYQHDPPVLYESQLKKEKFEAKKRKRQEANEKRDNTIEISDDGSNLSSRATSVATATPAPERESPEQVPATKRQKASAAGTAIPRPAHQEDRRDADGFLIPALPVDPALDQGSAPRKRGPGRPSKKQHPPIIVTEEELVKEQELEQDINSALEDVEVQDSRTEVEKVKDAEQARLIAEQQKQLAAQRNRDRRQTEGITWYDDRLPAYGDIVTREELEKEFANDPEVEMCILSEAEAIIKEQIWVTNNEDWLRIQREKDLISKVAAAAGRDGKSKKDGRGGRRKKKKGKMGDGSTLAEATTPIETAADAAAAMIEKRGDDNFSKHLDYDRVKSIFAPRASTSTNGSHSSSRDATTTPDGAGGNRTPSAADGAAEQDSGSASPSPTPAGPGRLQSSPTIQRVGAVAISPDTSSSSRPQPPASPPQTQMQAPFVLNADGHESDAGEPDEDDYVQDDEMDYESDAEIPPVWGGDDDDHEDYDEGDYRRAIDPEGGASIHGIFDDEY